MAVGARVRRRRRLMSLTQQELGTMCGVTFQQIQKYECGASRMSVSMVWKLALALDVEVAYFFLGLEREGDVKPEVRALEDLPSRPRAMVA